MHLIVEACRQQSRAIGLKRCCQKHTLTIRSDEATKHSDAMAERLVRVARQADADAHIHRRTRLRRHHCVPDDNLPDVVACTAVCSNAMMYPRGSLHRGAARGESLALIMIIAS